MRIVNLGELDGRSVEAFGSRAFSVFPLLPKGRVVTASLKAGGSIGAHPAPVDQLLVMLAGSATVTGSDGQPHEVTAGLGVLWGAEEVHSTQALTDVTALVIEGEGISSAFD